MTKLQSKSSTHSHQEDNILMEIRNLDVDMKTPSASTKSQYLIALSVILLNFTIKKYPQIPKDLIDTDKKFSKALKMSKEEKSFIASNSDARDALSELISVFKSIISQIESSLGDVGEEVRIIFNSRVLEFKTSMRKAIQIKSALDEVMPKLLLEKKQQEKISAKATSELLQEEGKGAKKGSIRNKTKKSKNPEPPLKSESETSAPTFEPEQTKQNLTIDLIEVGFDDGKGWTKVSSKKHQKEETPLKQVVPESDPGKLHSKTTNQQLETSVLHSTQSPNTSEIASHIHRSSTLKATSTSFIPSQQTLVAALSERQSRVLELEKKVSELEEKVVKLQNPETKIKRPTAKQFRKEGQKGRKFE